MVDCAILAPEGQRIGEQEQKNMARRRYQRGRVFLRERKGKDGRKEKVWVGRWREDELENGKLRRIERSIVLGTRREIPTERLARRALEPCLARVNDPRYRARPTVKFSDFATKWEALVLPQHKPSTQATVRSHISKYLVPFFGEHTLSEIQPELVQGFVSGLKVAPKTARNVYITLRMMWRQARAWGYVAHDAFDGLVLPKPRKARAFSFTVEEVRRILAAAEEPYRTFYWLAAETGMRAGELCGLRVEDLDLDRSLVRVEQSVWRGHFGDPKSEHPDRSFALSPELSTHLANFLRHWRPNERRLLFATRNGTAWDANLLVKRKLRPLLRSVGIDRGGLHAFRHANITLMDRLSVPLKVRLQRVGQSDARLTLGVYTHVASEDDRRVARQLGEILRPDAPKRETEPALPAPQGRWMQ